MTSRTLRKRTGQFGALLALTGLLTGAALALGLPTAGAVEFGNHNYLGKLRAEPPTGYPVSPAALDLSKGPVTLNVGVPVTNITGSSQTLTVQFSVHRILTYQGADVSDGQPGQAGISFPAGAAPNTKQVLYGARQNKTFTVPVGSAGTTMTFSAQVADCGYYQLDVSSPKSPYTYLASGFTRALGCQQAPPATPPATRVTVTTVLPTTTIAQVLGEQVTQPATLPVTGAATGSWLLIAGLLVLVGAGLMAVSFRPSRSS